MADGAGGSSGPGWSSGPVDARSPAAASDSRLAGGDGGGVPAGVLVAIDVGTSGARAAAVDLSGRRLLEARRSYPTASPGPGRAEQDPRLWRSASLGALADLVRRLGRSTRVLAIGLTGQCPSVCLVDRDGRPIGSGLIYRDNRATEEAALMRARFGDAGLHERTGHRAAAFHVAPKLLWLRDHEPAAFARAVLALQPRDLVALALTGVAATDGTHAAATLLYDLRGGRWDARLAEGVGLDPALLPPVRSPAEVLGTLRPVVATGPVSEMAGSSTCLNAVVDRPLEVLDVTHYPHVVGGAFTTETGINTTGAAVGWVADLLYGGRASRARGRDFDRLDEEAALAPAGAGGLLALPVLADGERTDPSLRGALVGLSLGHDRGSIARAMLEGVAFAIRAQLDLLVEGGVTPTGLRVSGGDARLGTWNRVKADVTGLPVTTIPGDAATTGVAMLAGIGAGVFRDAGEAIERCVHPDPAIEPDASLRTRYEEAFAAYLELARSPVVRRPTPTGGAS